MDDSDRQLVDELRDGLLQAGYQTAFEDDAEASGRTAHEGAELEGGNPLEDDFFVALNACRGTPARGGARRADGGVLATGCARRPRERGWVRHRAAPPHKKAGDLSIARPESLSVAPCDTLSALWNHPLEVSRLLGKYDVLGSVTSWRVRLGTHYYARLRDVDSTRWHRTCHLSISV